MRCAFVFQSVLLVGLLGPGISARRHANLPPSKVVLGTSSISSLHQRGGDDESLVEITTTNNSRNFLSNISPNNALQSMKEGYRQRVAADPAFLSKSIAEIIIAACTQILAEVSRRGKERMLPEIDFVFAGVLTAVFGKYYSMWKVARTVNAKNNTNDAPAEKYRSGDDSEQGNTNWREKVPTNAFQATLLDGYTKPTLASRFLAVILPMPGLFRAGVIASTFGYGSAWLLIQLRTIFVPHYVAETKTVSVPLAAIYTGVFLAIVSNIRYQLIQGLIEPYLIDGLFSKMEAALPGRASKFLMYMKRFVIVLVRWLGGLLGSWLNVLGMQTSGLQKLKG